MHSRAIMVLLSVLLCGGEAVGAWLDPAAPDVETVLSAAENQFSFYSGPAGQEEWLLNNGAASSTRLKGFQDVTGLQFGLASYRGRTVADAELHLARADTNPIYALVAATINAPWIEGRGWGSDAVAGEACWRWRSRPANLAQPAAGDEWAFSHSDFTAASFGNFGSLVSYGYGSDGTYGTYQSGGYTWVRMKLSPDLVHALILDQYGLMATDSRGHNLGYNPRVYTKEQNNTVRPRLLIRFSSTTDSTPPGAVQGLSAEAGDRDGEALLRWTAPTDPDQPRALGYTIRVGATNSFAAASDIARWRIPRPKQPGTAQQTLIESLPAGTRRWFFAQAYDQAGNAGPVASVSFDIPAAGFPAVLADGGLTIPSPAGQTVQTVPGILRYWACSETTQVNPATGNRLADGYTGSGADDYKKANAVWDSQSNTISLRAARNEVVGFQLVIERLGAALTNVAAYSGNLLRAGGGQISADPYVTRYQLHYVSSGGARYPDPAIPMASPFPATFSIPDANHNPGGQNQSVWFELYVPKDAAPGDYTGPVYINSNELGARIGINLALKVGAAQLPDFPTFLVDINGYSDHWNFGDSNLSRLRYFQLAQRHRVSLNILPYGWSADIHQDRAPTLTGSGASLHAASWAGLDNTFGPFFDGSAFTPGTAGSPYNGPGENTGVPTFYTTFFESWPTRITDATYGFDAAGQGGTYWNNFLGSAPDTYWTTLPDIYSAFPDGYKQGARNLAKEWFEHAQAKGWTQTNFQSYLNHKYYYNSCDALWALEECETGDDFRAMAFFQKLWQEGQAQASAPDVKWHWRLDISDRWGQSYGAMDGVINWIVMNGSDSDWHWPQLRYRNILNGRTEQWIYYGTGPAPQDRGDLQAPRFLRAWAQGQDGAIPYWENFHTDWNNADALAIVYSGQNVPGFGLYSGPIASIRLKLMRQAQQIVELANLAAAKAPWNRERAVDAVLAKYGDGGWSRSLGNMREDDIYKLHADLIAQLEPDSKTRAKPFVFNLR